MKSLVLFSICFFIWASSQAQLINIESQRVQSDSLRQTTQMETLYNYQKNNGEELSEFKFTLSHQLLSKNKVHTYILLGNIDYSSANNEDLSNSGLLHLRYNKRINDRVKLEVFAQTQFNRVLGVQSRNLIGIGPRYQIVAKSKAQVFLGSLVMQEFENIILNNEFNNDRRLSNYVSMIIGKSDRYDLSSVIYYQPNILGINDYRMSNNTTLSLNISKNLTFIHSLTFGYDSKPPANISKSNIDVSSGIRLSIPK